MGRLVITPKGWRWFRQGHPWIFRDDLARIDDAEAGEVVTLERMDGTFLAQGFYSDRSKIAFRLITSSKEPIGPWFWQERISQAFAHRQEHVKNTNAYRVVYGESDGIPSLIVDRYGNHFSIQTLSQGANRYLPVFSQIIEEMFSPTSITIRNDISVRQLEGLSREKRTLRGTSPERTEVFEGNTLYIADLWNGQKTGAYLDQRENRLLAANLLRGTVLDAFCYQGWFSVPVARQAARVIAIDSSQEALDRAEENANRNGLTNIEFLRENVFHFLSQQSREAGVFDGIILDPPAFAKNKEDLSGALRGYHELNRRAIDLLKPGGILVTSSCSYHLSENKFMEILKDCAIQSGSVLRMLAKRCQSVDHPILFSFPESYYLKCFFLQKIDL